MEVVARQKILLCTTEVLECEMWRDLRGVAFGFSFTELTARRRRHWYGEDEKGMVWKLLAFRRRQCLGTEHNKKLNQLHTLEARRPSAQALEL